MFHNWRGTFCYKVILFRLKNARATYQWMVKKIVFKNKIGRIIKGYVDDMLVKARLLSNIS
jgi:hypothetical protein